MPRTSTKTRPALRPLARSVAGFAAELGLPTSTVYDLIYSGRIDAKRASTAAKARYLITTTPEQYLESLADA